MIVGRPRRSFRERPLTRYPTLEAMLRRRFVATVWSPVGIVARTPFVIVSGRTGRPGIDRGVSSSATHATTSFLLLSFLSFRQLSQPSVVSKHPRWLRPQRDDNPIIGFASLFIMRLGPSSFSLSLSKRRRRKVCL